jgi:Protein of unknown function (DUF1236)
VPVPAKAKSAPPSGGAAFYYDKEEPMRRNVAVRLMALMLLCATPAFTGAGVELAVAQTNDIDEVVNTNGVAPKLDLTATQKSAIYQAVHKDKSKVAPSRFATNVGAEVPPMIELYMLPDDILDNNPVAKLYKFTRVDDQVVLVDPTNMRVTAVIGPNPAQ